MEIYVVKDQVWKSIGICLLFCGLACVLGPYSLSCVSAAVLVMMISGFLQAPGFAFVSGLLYLVIGIFLPVLPDWNHGMTKGFGALFGTSGGMLLALPILAFTIAIFRRLPMKYPALNLLIGLAAGFIVFFGFGLLWFVIKSGTVDLRAMGTAFLLYGLDAAAAFAAYPLFSRASRRKGG